MLNAFGIFHVVKDRLESWLTTYTCQHLRKAETLSHSISTSILTPIQRFSLRQEKIFMDASLQTYVL